MSKIDKVLIAGGGPVGVITGLYLARHGIQVQLFDMAEKPPEDHRAATLQPSTLDLFEELGLTKPILEQGFKSRYSNGVIVSPMRSSLNLIMDASRTFRAILMSSSWSSIRQSMSDLKLRKPIPITSRLSVRLK